MSSFNKTPGLGQSMSSITEGVAKRSWYALDVVVEAPAREAVEYGLMEANAVGTETNDDGDKATVRGYFASAPEIESVKTQLLEALTIYNLLPAAMSDVRLSEVPDRDWLAEWKKSWQPVQVGRFIIAPPWLAGAVAMGSSDSIASHDPLATAAGTDTIVIHIDPGMAFGTGTHETTRLCLKAIGRHYLGGSFLDVGTGTGILAIAAAKLAQKPDSGVPSRAARPERAGQGTCRHIVACDTDADAVEIATENAELNGVADRIDFRIGTVDDDTESADLVCANLTAPVIVELLPALIGATCGRLILSGILDSQIEMVKSRLLELGVVDFDIAQDGEWVSLTI